MLPVYVSIKATVTGHRIRLCLYTQSHTVISAAGGVVISAVGGAVISAAGGVVISAVGGAVISALAIPGQNTDSRASRRFFVSP